MRYCARHRASASAKTYDVGRVVKLALALLTVLNVALTGFGVSMAMLSPMMFDAGGDGRLLWTMFWSILAFPVVAGICLLLPWPLLWLRCPRAALAAAIIPVAYLAVLLAVAFIAF
jgi:hypothetical protein